jgi:hypothetical protein
VIVDAQWADGCLGWVAALLACADAVLALEPRYAEPDIGAVGPHPKGVVGSVEPLRVCGSSSGARMR